MKHDTYYSNDFGHKRKNDGFDPYYVFLAIITNVPVQTGFVVLAHICIYKLIV